MDFYSLLELLVKCFVLFHGVFLKNTGIGGHESLVSEYICEQCGNVGCVVLETANPALL